MGPHSGQRRRLQAMRAVRCGMNSAPLTRRSRVVDKADSERFSQPDGSIPILSLTAP
jgi:hypothetical protein